MKFILRYVLFALCLCLCLFSGWKLYSIFSEYRQGEKSYQGLTEQFVVTTPRAEGTADTPTAETVPGETAPQTEAGDTVPVTVDFDALLEVCPDVVGWLYGPDTPINYPIVQGRDNRYYLYRLLDGTTNSSGSIFADYRSDGDFSGWNTLLYGHNMRNDSMFGTLDEYKNQKYYDAHPVWYLLTPEQDYKIELLGGYTTTADAVNEGSFPASQAERDGLIAAARQHSTFRSDVQVGDGERIITFTTCAYSYDSARYVLVGVLRELPKPDQE